VEITLAEAYKGTTRVIELQVEERRPSSLSAFTALRVSTSVRQSLTRAPAETSK